MIRIQVEGDKFVSREDDWKVASQFFKVHQERQGEDANFENQPEKISQVMMKSTIIKDVDEILTVEYSDEGAVIREIEILRQNRDELIGMDVYKKARQQSFQDRKTNRILFEEALQRVHGWKESQDDLVATTDEKVDVDCEHISKWVTMADG